MILSFWGPAYFQGFLTVSFREGTTYLPYHSWTSKGLPKRLPALRSGLLWHAPSKVEGIHTPRPGSEGDTTPLHLSPKNYPKMWINRPYVWCVSVHLSILEINMIPGVGSSFVSQ